MTGKDDPTAPREAISEIIRILESLTDAERKKVLSAVHAYLEITPQSPPPPPSPTSGPPQDSPIQKDIRTLTEEKKPKTAIEMAAVMAYYLKEIVSPTERRESVNAKDVETYFKHAKFKLPKHSGQTLVNAKRAGYFDIIESGQFKLNAVGHNLVAHSLPKSSTDNRPRKKPRNKSKNKSASKKTKKSKR